MLFVGEEIKAGIKKRGIKQKYLKLSSFWKEEYPKGEVVGENIKYCMPIVVKPTTPPVGHPSFQKEGSLIP